MAMAIGTAAFGTDMLSDRKELKNSKKTYAGHRQALHSDCAVSMPYADALTPLDVATDRSRDVMSAQIVMTSDGEVRS